MAGEDTDFSASAELALKVPPAEKRRVESEVSDLGPMMLPGSGGRSRRRGGGSNTSASARAAMTPPGDDTGGDDLADVADLEEEMLRATELQNDLLRELLEDSGAALAGGDGGGGGGGGGGVVGGRLLGRAVGTVGTLAAGGVSATTLGAGAAAAALPYAAFGGDIKEDTNVPTNAQGEPSLLANIPDLDVERPSWLTADGTIGVEDPGTVRVDLVKETLERDEEEKDEKDSSKDRPGPGGSTPPSYLTGGPDGVVKNRELIEDSLDAGGDLPGGGSNSGGSPGGSTPPVSEVGGVDRNTSTGAGLVEAVLGDAPTTPDGSPGGSTPSRTGRRNEAAERRRQDAPDVDVAVTVDGSDLTEREVERIAEDKAEETGEEIARAMRGTRR